MKKNINIYIGVMSVLVLMFIFTFSKAQNDKLGLKQAYEAYQMIDDFITSEEHKDVAVNILNDVNEKFLYDTDVCFKQIDLYNELGEYEKAQEVIEKVFEEDPDLKSDLNMLDIYYSVLLLNGENEKAEEVNKTIESIQNQQG